MKKIAVITKNFPRHFDFIVSVMETGLLHGIVMVLDEENKFVNNNDMLNKYYQNSEHKFFGNKYNNISRIETITISDNNINSDKVTSFINNKDVDLTIIFDVNNINDVTLKNIKSEIWKVYFGYIQKYAGLNGNIYAAMNNKGQSICTSLITYKDNLYKGSIIHQTPSNFRQEDTVTDAEFRSLRKMMYDMEKLLNLYNEDKIIYHTNDNSMQNIPENYIETINMEEISTKTSFLVKNLIDEENFEFIKQI